MIKLKIYLLAKLLFISLWATAQQPDTIAFQLTDHNNISIQATLNSADTVQLMFHTAANGVTLIEEAAGRCSSIRWNAKEEVKSWGGESKSRYSESNTLQIGVFQWEDISIWENTNSGPTTDGKFGPNLFDNKIIEIDFDNSILILHYQLPEAITGFEKLPLRYQNGFMFIDGVSTVGEQIYPNQFLIHSGYGGTILYDDQFVSESKIGLHINITDEQELKDSYGNAIKTKKGSLPNLTIGTESFNDIPVGFFEGSIGRQKMSVLGGNLLKRLNIIIEANRAHIYIKPNSLKGLPY